MTAHGFGCRNRYASLLVIVYDDRQIMIRPRRVTTSGDHWRAVAGRISLLKTIDALKNPSPRWFGGEDARGGRDAALLNSLEEAVKEARERLGDDP